MLVSNVLTAKMVFNNIAQEVWKEGGSVSVVAVWYHELPASSKLVAIMHMYLLPSALCTDVLELLEASPQCHNSR